MKLAPRFFPLSRLTVVVSMGFLFLLTASALGCAAVEGTEPGTPGAAAIDTPASAEALVPEAVTTPDRKPENVACVGLENWSGSTDSIRREAQGRYNDWLDALTAEVNESSARWLHVVIDHTQNPAAVPYQNYPLPLNYTREEWLQLDERGLAVTRVALHRDPDGAIIWAGTFHKNVYRDHNDGRSHRGLPKRPSLDLNFFDNIRALSPRRGIVREEAELNDRHVFHYAVCQTYPGARPTIGQLPHPIIGDQKRLWLDAGSGQVLQTQWLYVDTTGRTHLDWQEQIVLLEFKDALPPQVQELLDRSALNRG